MARSMARLAVSFWSLVLLAAIAPPAPAHAGAISSSKAAPETSRAPGAQVECGPIGCRPLPPGCRQVRMGGQWLNDNGLRVVCDRKKN
jgi:hypothetical protein